MQENRTMNRKIVMLATCALVLAAGPVFAQEKGGAPADQEAMMKKWAEYAAPGANHKVLEKMVGNWTYLNKSWMDPNAPAMESPGKASYQMILGGRYLQQNYSGEFMGMPFEGVGFVGYDNFNKYFVSTWSDNTSTGIMTTTGGTMNDKGDLLFNGTMDDPITGQKNMKFREVVRWTGPDTFVFEMFVNSGAKEYKMMEITHTRVK
jgi:hypothetical protein